MITLKDKLIRLQEYKLMINKIIQMFSKLFSIYVREQPFHIEILVNTFPVRKYHF
jgi:hypothetical protein